MSDMQIRITGDGSGGERAIRANENALSKFKRTMGQVGTILRAGGLLVGFRMIASAVNEAAANADKLKGIISAADAQRIKQFAADMETASISVKAMAVNKLAQVSGGVREFGNFVMAAVTGADLKTAWEQRKGLAGTDQNMRDLIEQNAIRKEQEKKDGETQARIDQVKFGLMTREQQLAVLNQRIAQASLKTKEDELAVVEMLADRQKILASIEDDRAKAAEKAAERESEYLATKAAGNLATAMAVKDAFQGEGGLRGAMRAAKRQSRADERWQRSVGLAERNLARQGINPNDPSTWRKLSQADRRDLMLAQAGGVINQQGNPEALAAKAVDSLHETVKARLGFVGGA